MLMDVRFTTVESEGFRETPRCPTQKVQIPFNSRSSAEGLKKGCVDNISRNIHKDRALAVVESPQIFGLADVRWEDKVGAPGEGNDLDVL